MNKIFFCFFLAFSLSVLAEVDKKTTSLDLGDVSEGEIAHSSLNLDEEMKIIFISCDCLKAEIRTPEDEGPFVLRIQLDTSGYQDRIRQTVLLADRNNNLLEVLVQANTRP
ncbi:MAG: hypothetical protein JW867_06905 [Candidatus Omnitrophica bacterium]|nr:hypothetical protein [Candidatus Omnitrophota bacterium]